MTTEIVLDTETTGLSPEQGHRIVEIGCVELRNYVPTGRTFQIYLNPERDMPPGAFSVHGLSTAFLSQFPPFAQKAHEFLAFIQDAPLIIHNAPFDMKFLQAELSWMGLKPLANPVTDTLKIARGKFPGAPASLDMLCKRFQITNMHRDKHGALLDAHLLAQVYLELSGGRQPDLTLAASQKKVPLSSQKSEKPQRRSPLLQPGKDEIEAHNALLKELGAPLWKR